MNLKIKKNCWIYG
uniref:Uncharacterized protein n=1 Tax=Lepeophtheirus salmonis TaxID=72036 RepID=A0A0K2VI01_LEPSM